YHGRIALSAEMAITCDCCWQAGWTTPVVLFSQLARPPPLQLNGVPSAFGLPLDNGALRWRCRLSLLGGLRCGGLHGRNCLVLLPQHVFGILKVEKLHLLAGDQLHRHAGQSPSVGLTAQRPNYLIRFFTLREFLGPDATDMRTCRVVGQHLGWADLVG